MATSKTTQRLLGVLAASSLASCQPSPHAGPTENNSASEQGWMPKGPYGEALRAGDLEVFAQLGDIVIPQNREAMTQEQANRLADALRNPHSAEDLKFILRSRSATSAECEFPSPLSSSEAALALMDSQAGMQLLADVCDTIHRSRAAPRAIGPYSQLLSEGNLTVKLTLGQRTVDMANLTADDVTFLKGTLESPEKYKTIPAVIGARDGSVPDCKTSAQLDGSKENLRVVLAEALKLDRMALQCDMQLQEQLAPENQAPESPPIDPNRIASLNPYPDRKVDVRIHFGPLAQHSLGKNA